MHGQWLVLALGSVVLLTGCGSRQTAAVEALGGGQDVASLTLRSLSGKRDGERVAAQVTYGDGARSLNVELRFLVTPPARLEVGSWSGLGGQGSVRERALTFLGGQSGPPSIGGRFDLLGADHQPVYRIYIPTQPLQ